MKNLRTASPRASSALAVTLALCWAIAGCGGGASTATNPLPTADVSTDEPEATEEPEPTDAPEATAPADSVQPGASLDPNDLGNGRPVTVTVTVSGTTTQGDGSYTATGVSRACGNAAINMTGNTKAFNLEFPFEETPQVRDVAFTADDLLPGTTTSSFHIGVSIQTPVGHEPPSIVIDTMPDGPGHTGTAQRSEANGTTTLIVDGVDDLGVTLHMTATCGPRPG